MGYPTQFRYSKDHEWIDVQGDTATVGITDYAQGELGDVVFVEVPAAGTKVTAGKTFGSVESVKAVSDIYAPATGEVVESNVDLKNKPEAINTDPHGAGWLVKIKMANPSEVNSLMDAAAYEAYIAEKKKEASA
jgi:glycine cleavage system H protein